MHLYQIAYALILTTTDQRSLCWLFISLRENSNDVTLKRAKLTNRKESLVSNKKLVRRRESVTKEWPSSVPCR